MTKTTTSTSKYSRHIQPFIDLVESEKLRTSKEVKALVNHVKWCFDNEDIYVNDELADKYLGLSKYFPFEEVFPLYVKDNERYKAFLESYNDAVGVILNPPSEDAAAKAVKALGTVGLAVATGGASLAAQKIYDDNKSLVEKNIKLCQYGAWHFANNCLEEFLGIE